MLVLYQPLKTTGNLVIYKMFPEIPLTDDQSTPHMLRTDPLRVTLPFVSKRRSRAVEAFHLHGITRSAGSI